MASDVSTFVPTSKRIASAAKEICELLARKRVLAGDVTADWLAAEIVDQRNFVRMHASAHSVYTISPERVARDVAATLELARKLFAAIKDDRDSGLPPSIKAQPEIGRIQESVIYPLAAFVRSYEGILAQLPEPSAKDKGGRPPTFDLKRRATYSAKKLAERLIPLEPRPTSREGRRLLPGRNAQRLELREKVSHKIVALILK